MKIRDVNIHILDAKLAEPFAYSQAWYERRGAMLVEIVGEDGNSGWGEAFGPARLTAPVAEFYNSLLIGADALATEAIWQSLYNRLRDHGQKGLAIEALSAVDIALWDLKGKVAGMPVWRLLGGARTVIPALVAGGYAAAGKTTSDLAEEVAGYAAQGFRMIKIAAASLAEDTARLEASREAAGADAALMYDAHWAWRDVDSVARVVRGWERFDLDWIEDPYPTELNGLIDGLRARTGIRLAVGEDLSGRSEFDDLMARGRADVIRVDVTTAGGFTEVAKICALAATRGVPVSPHIFPELHVHLAAAYSGILALEVTDPGREIDVSFKLLERPLEARSGEISAPSSPGLGIAMDWSAVESFAAHRD